MTASDPGVVFRVVRRTPSGFDTEPVQDGITVPGPAPGEAAWITAASGVDADVTIAPVGADPPPDPSRVSWSQLEARPYRYTWSHRADDDQIALPLEYTNPLGRTDARAFGDLATLGFDLYSFAEDPVPIPYVFTSADAIAELSGTVRIESGLHAVTVRIRLDDVNLTTTRSVPSAFISTADGSLTLELSCADASPGCSAYDSASYSQSSDAQPGVVTLRAVIDVPAAQMLKVSTTVAARSAGRGGSAEATLAGEVIEAGIVKL